MKKLIEKIWFNIIYREKGATAVEYALIVTLIAAAIVLTVTALGGGLKTAFQNITNAFTGA
jgi:pilus assembly protein Flp/PilA